MSKYYKALADRKPVTAIPDGLTRISVELTIAGITEQLRGPCSNTERVMLVHDRRDARDILALMIAEDTK